VKQETKMGLSLGWVFLGGFLAVFFWYLPKCLNSPVTKFVQR